MIEYYTGRDASRMSDDEIAMKMAHLDKIRQMEYDNSLNNLAQLFSNGKRD